MYTEQYNSAGAHMAHRKFTITNEKASLPINAEWEKWNMVNKMLLSLRF